MRILALAALAASMLCMGIPAHADTQYPFWTTSLQAPLYPSQLGRPQARQELIKPRKRHESQMTARTSANAAAEEAAANRRAQAEGVMQMGTTIGLNVLTHGFPGISQGVCIGFGLMGKADDARRAGEPLWGPNEVTGNTAVSIADCLLGYSEAMAAPPPDRPWITFRTLVLQNAMPFFVPFSGLVPAQVWDIFKPRPMRLALPQRKKGAVIATYEGGIAGR